MKTAFQKKAYSILTALVLLLTACTGAVFSSSRAAALELEGTGKADNPYLLSTAAELLEFAEKAAADPNICATLTADISLAGETWTPIGSYAGTFDGNYHCISNLQCSGGSNLGMFAKLSGTVQKLGLTNVHIQGKILSAELRLYAAGRSQIRFVRVILLPAATLPAVWLDVFKMEHLL